MWNKKTSLYISNLDVHGQKRTENMWKLFNKEKSLLQTTEITQANPCKNAAFTIATIGSNWTGLFSETCEIIFKDTHGIGFTAFFSELWENSQDE